MLPGKATDCAEGRQGNFTHAGTVRIVNLELVVHIVQVGDNKVIVDESDIINHVGLFRQDFSPVFASGIFSVDCDDAPARGVQVGMKIENGIKISDKVVAGIGIVQKPDERRCA